MPDLTDRPTIARRSAPATLLFFCFPYADDELERRTAIVTSTETNFAKIRFDAVTAKGPRNVVFAVRYCCDRSPATWQPKKKSG